MWRVVLLSLFLMPGGLSASTIVNINTADSEALQALPGIGETYAQRIIEYREEEGLFDTIDEIQNVSGIGPATFEKIQDQITVSEDTVVEEEEAGELSFEVIAPDTVFVHELVSFDVNWEEDTERLVRYQWNFGDTVEDTGTRPEHRFEFPGTYVVTVTGKSKGDEYTSRHEITVLPTMFSITQITDAVHIHNNAPAEVQMGGYMLSATETVIIPSDTIVLPYATLTIARERIGDGLPRLYDATGALVAHYEVQETITEPIREEEIQSAAVIDAVPQTSNNMAYVGLVAVLGIGIIGVYTRRKEVLDIEDLEKTV